jgi:hypothetical protein
LGIRPASAGFKTVTIRPQLGPLDGAKGSMVHPAGGTIDIDVRQVNGKLTGSVQLPGGVGGVLIANGKDQTIGGNLSF